MPGGSGVKLSMRVVLCVVADGVTGSGESDDVGVSSLLEEERRQMRAKMENEMQERLKQCVFVCSFRMPMRGCALCVVIIAVSACVCVCVEGTRW